MKTAAPLLAPVLFLLLAFGPLFGQEDVASAAKAPLPPPPWPARTADMSSWTVTLDLKGTGDGDDSSTKNANGDAPSGSGAPSAKPIPTLQSVTTVTKTWPIVHEVTVNPAGQKWDKWYHDGVEITLAPTSHDLIVMHGSGNNPFFFQDYSKSDFDGFGWLSAKNFRGIAPCHGHQCYYFRNPMQFRPFVGESFLGPDDSIDTPNSETGVRRYYAKAYLDVKTLLPVMMQKGPSVWTYQFGQSPTVQLEIPADFLKQLGQRVAKEKLKEIPPARPY